MEEDPFEVYCQDTSDSNLSDVMKRICAEIAHKSTDNEKIPEWLWDRYLTAYQELRARELARKKAASTEAIP